METESDIRNSMLLLSKSDVVQFILTILTGQAHSNQRTMFRSTPLTQLFNSSLCVMGGIAASIVIVEYLPVYFYFLLLASWLITVSGARKAQAEMLHQMVHKQFSGNLIIDQITGQILTTTLFIQDFIGYLKDHSAHHSKALASYLDPDAIFLFELGFKPGTPKKVLWLKLLKSLVSPQYHFKFLYERFLDNFVRCSNHRKVLSLVWWTVLMFTIWEADAWVTFLIAVVFPLTILYQCSALLHFLTEHRWFKLREGEEDAKSHLAKLTTGRFFGERYTRGGFSYILWWLLKMIMYHSVCRLFVCPGNLVVHDWHHQHQNSVLWPNAIFWRQNEIDNEPGQPKYFGKWGLLNMLNDSFEHLAALQPKDKI